MQMRQFIRVSTIINLFRLESFLHGTSDTRYICHKSITIFITQFIQIVHMVFIRNKTTSTVGLFLKQKHT